MTTPDKLTYKPLPFKPLQAQRLVMENGIILYILEDHELPLVNVSAVFRAGSAYDPADKAGLAELTARMMRTGGMQMMNGNAVDDTFAFYGISLGFSTETDFASAHLSALKQNWVIGFDLFSQMLMKPAFEEKKLQLAKDLLIEELRGVVDEPSKFAFREFRKLLYRGNPRGNLTTPSSIKTIQRPDLIDFHKRYFYPLNIMITITGDITPAVALDTVRRYFGSWQVPGKTEKIPHSTSHQDGMIYHIQKDIPQSVIITGRLSPSKKSSDFYPFTVLDFILGSGGFQSRIFQEVRSNRGLAYSTGSFYRARDEYGVFGAYAITKSSSTTEVLSLIRTIIGGMKDKGVRGSELAWAKKSLNNRFIFSFQSVDQIAYQQMMIEYDTLPQNFLFTYRKKIGEVSEEDINHTAARYFTSQNFVTLVLGNETAFDKPLSDLGKVIKID
ncbi:MAG: pitrilysin family protein [Deltaproteobacteria bacterium]|nr:pitrilysin family protein [Deltaproteobacteria bacterium]